MGVVTCKRHRNRSTIERSTRYGDSLRSSSRSQAGSSVVLSPIRSTHSNRVLAPSLQAASTGSITKTAAVKPGNEFFKSDLSNLFGTQNFRVHRKLFKREEQERSRFQAISGATKDGQHSPQMRDVSKRVDIIETTEQRVHKIGEALKRRLYTKFDRLRQMFRACDRDNDGSISVQDFQQLLSDENFQISQEDMNTLIAVMDTSKTGCVSYKEFIQFFQQDGNDYKTAAYAGVTPFLRILREFAHRHSELRTSFRRFDEDKNGSISTDEFQQVVKILNIDLHPNELEEVIRKFDTDGDGKVNYEEFVTQIESIDPKSQLLRPPKWRHDTRKPKLRKRRNNFRAASTAELEIALHEKIYNAKRRIKKAFNDFDKDQDGQISYDEFRTCLGNLNLSINEKEMRELWRLCDADDSGRISLDEFIVKFQEPPVKGEKTNIKGNAERVREAMMTNSKRMAEVFAKFDTSGDGLISNDEFLEGLKTLETDLSEEELMQVIKYVDRSGDGYINFDEFETALSFRVEFEATEVDPFEVRRAMGLMRQEKGIEEPLSPTSRRRAQAALHRQHQNIKQNLPKVEEAFRQVAVQGDNVKDLKALEEALTSRIGIDANDARILIRATIQRARDNLSFSTNVVQDMYTVPALIESRERQPQSSTESVAARLLGEPGVFAEVDGVRAKECSSIGDEDEDERTVVQLIEKNTPTICFKDFMDVIDDQQNQSLLHLDPSRTRFPSIPPHGATASGADLSLASNLEGITVDSDLRRTAGQDGKRPLQIARSAHSQCSSAVSLAPAHGNLNRNGRFDRTPYHRDTSHVVVPQPGTAAFLDRSQSMKQQAVKPELSSLGSSGVTLEVLDERRRLEEAHYEAKLQRRRRNEKRVVQTYTDEEKQVVEKGIRRVEQRTHQQLRYLHAMGAV